MVYLALSNPGYLPIRRERRTRGGMGCILPAQFVYIYNVFNVYIYTIYICTSVYMYYPNIETYIQVKILLPK